MKIFTARINEKLSSFTDTTYPQGSFCFNALLKKGDIKINGKRVKSDVFVSAGDIISYYTTPAQEGKKSHEKVFEDENVYIADKLSGVSSEGLLSELGEGFFAVHRLDRNTEGLIIFAKNKEAESELLRAFRERKIIKKYIALCKNNFMRDGGTLTAYLKKDAASAFVSVYDTPQNGAQKIITEYKVLENRGSLALVEIILHTGKTHQIRAHMAHIGCPVLGDSKYGDKALNKEFSAARQKLVSKSLKFCLSDKLSYLKEFESGFKL